MSGQNRIRVRANGPLLCTGDIEVYDDAGRLLEKSDDVALCRCGASANKPFCDGSHRQAGFRDDGQLAAATEEVPEPAGGPLKIRVQADAMLVARGPMTILSVDRSQAITRNRAALCRCGHSAGKPFCDGRHRRHGFRG